MCSSWKMLDFLGMTRRQLLLKELEYISPLMYALLLLLLLMIPSHTPVREKCRAIIWKKFQGNYSFEARLTLRSKNQYAPKRRTIVQKLLGTNRPQQPHGSFIPCCSVTLHRDLTSPLVDGEGLSSPSENYMEGYLTKKGDAGGLFFSEPWSRRYFVLQDRDLYYYKSREDYQLDPQKSIKNRPIHMTG